MLITPAKAGIFHGIQIMLSLKISNRYQAFGVHLLGSLIVALLSSALVFLVWYRWPLPVATGVTEIFVILLAVDVLIGPFITLIVFNLKKKELRRDLMIVLLLQIGALLYGMHAVYVARPVYLVFNVDRFDLVYANDISKEKLSKVTDPQFQSVPLFGTEVIAARGPERGKARNDILFSAVQGGDDVPQIPQYYVPYAKLAEEIQKRILPLDDLKIYNEEHALAIDALANKYASIKGGIGFFPARGKVADLTVIVRKDSAEVLEIKDWKPWKY